MRQAIGWTAALLLLAAGCGNVKTEATSKTGANSATGTLTQKSAAIDAGDAEKGNAPSIKAATLKGGIVTFRLNPDERLPVHGSMPVPKSFHGYAIVEEKPVDDAKVDARIRQVLDDDATYGNTFYKCFEPGMGFRIGEGAEQTDYVICLKCMNMEIYAKDPCDSDPLSDKGVAELSDLYYTLFPDAGKAKDAKATSEAKTP